MKTSSLAWAIAAIFIVLPPAAQAATPTEKLIAPGLSQPVEMLKDHWGISHIYAKNENDLFFAQGYSAARDRLFEFEIFRRRANGTIAEILGPREVNRDIGARQFLYRGDMDKELAVYHPHGRAIFEAFAKGVNAYIDQANKNPAALPPEFKMLGIKPAHWTVETALARANSVSLGQPNANLQMTLAVHALGADKIKDLVRFQPANPDLRIDPAIDVSLMNRSILDTYNAWTSSVKFTPEELAMEYRATKKASLENSGRLTRFASLDDEAALPDAGLGTTNPRADMGSNNWLVSGCPPSAPMAQN